MEESVMDQGGGWKQRLSIPFPLHSSKPWPTPNRGIGNRCYIWCVLDLEWTGFNSLWNESQLFRQNYSYQLKVSESEGTFGRKGLHEEKDISGLLFYSVLNFHKPLMHIENLCMFFKAQMWTYYLWCSILFVSSFNIFRISLKWVYHYSCGNTNLCDMKCKISVT